METLIKILPIIAVFILVFLVKEGLSFYRYLKTCQLHEAAKTGDIDRVRKLIGEGHSVYAVDSRFGLTPLHYAVRNGRVEAAILLIENGASLNQPSTQGITPLDWAAEYLGPDERNSLLRSAAGDKKNPLAQNHKNE